MKQEYQEQQMMNYDVIMPPEATAFEWVELLMPAILAFLSVVIPAYIGWRIVRMKVNQHNSKRKDRYHLQGRDEEFEEHTAMDYFRDKHK